MAYNVYKQKPVVLEKKTFGPEERTGVSIKWGFP